MSPPGHHDGGVPRGHQRLTAPPGSPSIEEDWSGANEAKVDKLRWNEARRRARTHGLQLRHSAYGYALIGTAHKPVNDRNNMSLDEVESWLDQAPSDTRS